MSAIEDLGENLLAFSITGLIVIYGRGFRFASSDAGCHRSEQFNQEVKSERAVRGPNNL
jgi:hypothetical protein